MTRKRLYLISAVGRSAYVCLNMPLKSIVIEWIKIVSPQKLTALGPIKSSNQTILREQRERKEGMSPTRYCFDTHCQNPC